MSYIPGPKIRPPRKNLYWWQAIIGLLPFEEDRTIPEAVTLYFKQAADAENRNRNHA